MRLKKTLLTKRTAATALIAATFLVTSAVATAILLRAEQSKTPSPIVSTAQPKATKPATAAKTQSFTLAAMGDMLAHDTINQNAQTATGYDYTPYFSNIVPILRQAGVVFCNQEGASAGTTYGISGYPSFNAPVEFTRDLSKTGCNLINLANNHIADAGRDGLLATLEQWQKYKTLAVAGANRDAAEQNTVRYSQVNGIKLAFLAFAEFSNNRSIDSVSVNSFDENLIRKLATEARASADVVIVSMHWGTEDSEQVNNEQKRLATLLVSLGVDVVLGTGPHVLQKVESLPRDDGQQTLVWYSLGNFLSSQLEINQLIGGIALMDITKKDGKTSASNIRFVPSYMHYDWPVAARASGNLSARTNPKLYVLQSAAEPLGRSHHGTNVEQQLDYVLRTLGQKVKIVDTF